jgi:GntR family transcriptional regulator
MENPIVLPFQIKPGSGVPIYRQLMEQVVRLVSSGALKAGDELPSVRQLAGHYEINPMTVSKAYSLLEATGVLERVRGRGMVVASDQSGTRSLKKRMELLEPVLREAAAQAAQLDLPKEAVLQALGRFLGEAK